MQRSPNQQNSSKGKATVSMRRTNQNSPGATSQNNDLRSDLLISGTKAQLDAISGLKKKEQKSSLKVLNVEPGKKDGKPIKNGSKTNKGEMESTVSKWKRQTFQAGDDEQEEEAQRLRRDGSQGTGGEKEDVLTQLSGSQSRLMHNMDDTQVVQQNAKESGARLGSEGRATDYALILKLGEIQTTKKGAGGIRIVRGSGQEEKQFGLTQMQQSPKVYGSSMELAGHIPGGGLQNLGQTYTTFRRTPMRVRVEDLMTVDEKGNKPDENRRSITGSADDKLSSGAAPGEPKIQGKREVGAPQESIRTSKQLAAASKRFTTLINESSTTPMQKKTKKKTVHMRVNSVTVTTTHGLKNHPAFGTKTTQNMSLKPIGDELEGKVSLEPPLDANEARYQRRQEESQRSMEANARIAQRLNRLPKLTSSSQMHVQQQMKDSLFSHQKKSTFNSMRHRNNSISLAINQQQMLTGNVSYHMQSSGNTLQSSNKNQQAFQQNQYEQAVDLKHGISISNLPSLPQLRTAIAEIEDSHEDSINNAHLPASVPVSRNHDKEKRFLEDMKNLEHVLSQQTLAYDSSQAQLQVPTGVMKNAQESGKISAWRMQEKEQIGQKPQVLSENLFSEQQKSIAKRVFMNRLGSYLENQQSGPQSEMTTLAMNNLTKQAAKMESPFFLMKRKKSVQPPTFEKKRGSQSFEPNLQQVSFANLRDQNNKSTALKGKGNQNGMAQQQPVVQQSKKSLSTTPKNFVSQASIVSQLPIGFSQKELLLSPQAQSKKILLPQEKERILQESRLFLNDSTLIIDDKVDQPEYRRGRNISSRIGMPMAPQLSPFTPLKVPSSILSLSRIQGQQLDQQLTPMNSNRKEPRDGVNHSALILGKRNSTIDQQQQRKALHLDRSLHSVAQKMSQKLNNSPSNISTVNSQIESALQSNFQKKLSIGTASFALLTPAEQDKKVAEMGQYMQGLQSQISMSALGLSKELATQHKKMVGKKDAHVPRRRQAHAYMYDRALDASDTISMAYPNMTSSIYYASLTSSMHKINGTKKRDHVLDGASSVAHQDELSQIQIDEINSEEEELRKQEEWKKFRNNVIDKTSTIKTLKQQVSMGILPPDDYQGKIGPSTSQLKLMKINQMVGVKSDPEEEEQKNFAIDLQGKSTRAAAHELVKRDTERNEREKLWQVALDKQNAIAYAKKMENEKGKLEQNQDEQAQKVGYKQGHQLEKKQEQSQNFTPAKRKWKKPKKNFRKLYDEYTETLRYKDQMRDYPNYLHSEMDKVHDRVEHPNVQQKLLIEVLDSNFSENFTDYMESLAHVKNEKTMNNINEAPEFKKLVNFINDFLEIGDHEKSKGYVNYLISELKILSLLELSNKNFLKDIEKKEVQNKKKQNKRNLHNIKLPKQKNFEDIDSAISFGEHSADDSDEQDLESHQTQATLQNWQENNESTQKFGVAASADLSKRLLQKMEFGSMMKAQQSPVSNSQINKEAKFQFCKEISKHTKLARPMLDLESNSLKELRLARVALSIEQIRALAKSMPLMPNIQKLHLEDTNLTDIAFSLLLGSIEKSIPSFRSITYKGHDNKYGEKSHAVLVKILQRKVPFQLTCLQLEGIKIEKALPAKLLSSIARQSVLEKLSLANIKLDTAALKVLCYYLNKNYSLKNLNLKQLNIPVREFAMLLPFIAENCKLQHLNLSGNTLVDSNCDAYDLYPLEELNSGQMSEVTSGGATGKKKGKDTPKAKDNVEKKKQRPIKRRILQKVTQEYVLEFLKKFMTKNQSLIHFDLTNTGIDDWGVVEIAQLLKDVQENSSANEPQKLRNLAGLHLSFPDQFYKASLVKELDEIFNPFRKLQSKINVGSMLSIGKEEEQKFVEETNMMTVEDKKQRQLQDLAALKSPFNSLGRDAKSFKPVIEGDAYENQDIICLQRLYNHENEFAINRKEIPIKKWQAFVGPPSKTCWLCAKHKYTLFFAKVEKSVAEKNDVVLQILPPKVAQPNYCVMAMNEGLVLKMEPIRDFGERIDTHHVKKFNYLKHFREQGRIPPIATRVNDLNQETLFIYLKLLEEYKQERYQKEWEQVILRQLHYSQIQAIGNYGDVGDNEVLMVCAAMIRPGKIQYVIKSEVNGYCTPAQIVICQPRTEDELPNLSQKYKYQMCRDFTKDQSMFAEFKDETVDAKERESSKQNMVRKQMLDHDMKHWGVSLIGFDKSTVNAIIPRNYEQLTALYQSLAAVGDKYPYVSYTTYMEFCQAMGIIEDATQKNIEETKRRSRQASELKKHDANTIQTKYKQFYASFTADQASMSFAHTFFGRDQLVKDDQVPLSISDFHERQEWVIQQQIQILQRQSQAVLNRCQFLEVLITIAIDKYHHSECDMPIALAMRRLIDEDLSPNIKVVPSTRMRRRQIFTKEVDILFRSNEETLQYAFEKYAAEPGGKFITHSKIQFDILGHIFKIGSQKAQVLYSRCKMPIANETGNADGYKRLRFVEFLELLCRVTHKLFRQNPQNELKFHEQLKYVLDQLLWRVGVHRNDPKIHWQELEYDSDDDTISDEESFQTESHLSSSINKSKKKSQLQTKSTLKVRIISTLNMVADQDMDFSSVDLSQVAEEEEEAKEAGSPDKLQKGGAVDEDEDQEEEIEVDDDDDY